MELSAVLVATEAGGGSLRKAVQMMALFIYADCGLLDSTHPEWLQGLVDVLTGIY